MIKRKDKVILLTFLIALFLSSLSTARDDVVTPLLVLAVIYNKTIKQIKLQKVVLIFILLAILAGITLWYRSSLSVNPLKSSELPKIALRSAPFVEFKHFCRIIQKVEYYGFDNPSLLFKSILYPLVPNQLFAVLEIDKPAVISEIWANLWDWSDGWQNRLRFGAFGELFLNSGIYGLLAGSFILGLLMGWLDRALNNAEKNESRILIISFLSVALVYAPIQQLANISARLYFILPWLIVTYFICRKKSIRKQYNQLKSQ